MNTKKSIFNELFGNFLYEQMYYERERSEVNDRRYHAARKATIDYVASLEARITKLRAIIMDEIEEEE